MAKKEDNLPNIEMNNLENKVDKINNDINSLVYGEKLDNELNKKFKEVQNIVSSINSKYEENIGTDIIEFFSSIDFKKNSNGKYKKKNNTKKNFENILKDITPNLINSSERQRVSRYHDYELITTYIPFISKAINVYRDNILSPDDITKDFLNFSYNGKVEKDDSIRVIDNLKLIDEKYKISKKIGSVIRDSLKLGDQFISILNINDAYNDILSESELFQSNSSYNTGNILMETDLTDSESNNILENLLYESLKENEKNSKNINKNEIRNLKKDIVKRINNNIKFYNEPSNLISEVKKTNDKSNETIKEINGLTGSILKILDPTKVIVIEIDDTLIGYIYYEKNNSIEVSSYNKGIMTSNDKMGIQSLLGSDLFNVSNDYNENNKSNNGYDMLSKIMVKGISKKLNKKFLQDNKNFQNLIYTLLKDNYIIEKGINFTFLTPNQVVHFKPESNFTYGKSILQDILLIAKIYLATLITNLMQKVSRGRDKRAFYVDVGIDDDIEGVVQGVIKDIKSSEITADTFKDIDTMLNCIGAFEDYFFPTINGEKPIEIDTVSGMDVDVDNEFLENLKKNIISGMSVPANYIETDADVEFARSLAMTNNNFVRNIINFQNDFGNWITELFRLLYKNEFPEEFILNKKDNDDENYNDNKIKLNLIEVKFPTPVFLLLSNNNDQISNVQSLTDFIINLYFQENSEDPNNEKNKLIFRKKIISEIYMPTLPWSRFDELFKSIKINTSEESLINKTVEKDNAEINTNDGMDDF